MRFEGKELGRAIRYVPPASLKEGEVYFHVRYLEHELFVPELVAFVFIGRDLSKGDHGYVYFQDFTSYQEGTRFGKSREGAAPVYERFLESQGSSVCDFDDALDELMRCALRRQQPA